MAALLLEAYTSSISFLASSATHHPPDPFASTAAAATPGWPQPGGSWQHAGVSTYSWPSSASSPSSPVSQLWNRTVSSQVECGGGVVLSSSGVLYFTCGPLLTSTYTLYAVHANTGALLWQSPFTERSSTTQGWTPALSSDESLVFVRAASLQAFRASNGSLAWQATAIGGALREAPVVHGARVYLRRIGGVAAYEAASGVLRWLSPDYPYSIGPAAIIATPTLTPSGGVAILALQQLFNASRDHLFNPRLHLMGVDTSNGRLRWYFNLSLVFPPNPGNSPWYLNYGVTAAVGAQELFYLSVFPHGLLVVDTADGSFVTPPLLDPTNTGTMVSPVFWPASAPNNPYYQPAILHVVGRGDCQRYPQRIPCQYQLQATGLRGETLQPPLPPPSTNATLQCPEAWGKAGQWVSALPLSQPVMTADGLLVMAMGWQGSSGCLAVMNPATGAVVDVWNPANATGTARDFGVEWAVMVGEGRMALSSLQGGFVYTIGKGAGEEGEER